MNILKKIIPHSRPFIVQADYEAIQAVLKTEMLVRGKQVELFEAELGQYIAAESVVAVSSGTAALVLALKALGVTFNDEVIIPTYTCDSVLKAVKYCGATPILCDIGTSWVVTPKNIIPHINSKTKAIILIHTFGIIVDIDSFKEFNVPIIEDCCQAFGAFYNNRRVGVNGSFGIFSFHATKCLTTGEGGAVVVNDNSLLDRLKAVMFEHPFLRTFNDMQAALGRSQLSRYDEILMRRIEIADFYFNNLKKELIENMTSFRDTSLMFRFLIRTKANFEIKSTAFEQRGIFVRRGVDNLLHRNFSISDDIFPNAVEAFNQTISLPIYPALSHEEAEYIVAITKEVFS